LQYRINRLGGRSKQEKWLLQAELFNEIYRWVKPSWAVLEPGGTDKRAAAKYYEQLRDFFKAAATVWGEAWGNGEFMVTKPETLKALIRVGLELGVQDAEPVENRVARWQEKLKPWAEQLPVFRKAGFYERFPAKGQFERVGRIQRDLAKWAGIPLRKRGAA
jgi:hypothetical protein